MKMMRRTAAAVFCAAILALFPRNGAAEEQTLQTGGFVAAESAGGTWRAGAPGCFGKSFPGKVVDAALKDKNADDLVINVSALALPWAFSDDDKKAYDSIPLKGMVDGGNIAIEIKGAGTLASTADLSLYNSQTGLDAKTASFLSGAATNSLPESGTFRIVGLSLATADVRLDTTDEKHPLNGILKATLLYATVEYIAESEASSSITTVEKLRKHDVKAITFLGLKCAVSDEKSKVFECRWVGDAPPEYVTASTSPIGDVGSGLGLDVDLVTRSVKTEENGTVQMVTIPASTINGIIDLGLEDDLTATRLGAPGGNMLIADMPSFSVPVPGLSEALKFSSSRLSLTLGSSSNGSQFGFSIDAGLDNPGILLGSLGTNITGSKRVTLTVEGKTLVVNFHNALGDFKPLGFSLLEPTVAVDLDKKSVKLSGSLQLPDTLPIEGGKSVDVTCELSKSSVQFMLVSAVEVPIFGDRITLSLNTLALGATDGNVYFMAQGKAKFVEDVSLLEGIESFKKLGINLTVGAEVTASMFVQSDGTFHVELLTEDLVKLEVGAVSASLDEVKFVLDYAPGSSWVASISGQTTLDINAGVVSVHITSTASFSTDGTLEIAIPYDPDNPTRITVGDLTITLVSGKFLVAKNSAGQYEVSIDATVSTTFPKEIPLIGGQALTGHIALKSDGTFVFELTKIPGLDFYDMKVGLTSIKIQNKKENNSYLLSFEAGAGVEFKSSFALPPLRNEKISGTVSLSSDLTVKFTLSGLTISIGDFRFGLSELSIGVEKGRDIAVSATAVLEVKYPSSKYFGIGLPAALAGKDTGPDFDISGTLSITATNVYFQAKSDSMELPIDIPDVIEGVTLRVEQIGVGITYEGIPLFDLKGAIYLPDLNGEGKTGTTPTLARPYDSKLGLKLAGNVQEGIVLAVETEGSPTIAIKPVFEFTLDEAGVSTWLYGYAFSGDLSTRIKIGQPENGLGTLFDLKKGHLTCINVACTPIFIPFYDSCRIETNVGGFGMAMESEFPRPTLLDIGVILDVVKYIQKGQVVEIFNQCGRGGKFNSMFPRFAVREASLFMPASAAEVLNAPAKLNLLDAVGGQIDLNSGDIVPLLPRVFDAVSNPKDTLAGLVSSIPEQYREGNFPMNIGIKNFNLLSGNLHYKLQAREQVYVNRSVPNLGNLLQSLDIINTAEQQEGAYTHQQWLLTKNDDGYYVVKNRKSGKYLTLKNAASTENGAALVQKKLGDTKEFFWSKSSTSDGAKLLYNCKSGLCMSASDEGVFQYESGSDNDEWTLVPVYGTSYVQLYNNAAGKLAAVTGGSTSNGAELALEDRPASETLAGVTITPGTVKLGTEIGAAKAFVDRLNLAEDATSAALMKQVRGVGAGKKITGTDGTGLSVAVTSSTTVSVSPYGHVSTDIGCGTLELRAMLDNAPAPAVIGTLKALDLDTVASVGGYPYKGIVTTRDVTMGNPDCHAARTWKKLWSLRDTGKAPTFSEAAVTLKLKNGASVAFTPTVYCRVVMDVVKTRYATVAGKQVNTGDYTVKVREWRQVNSATIDASGRLQVQYRSDAFNSPKFVLFDPAQTGDDGAGGMRDTTLSISVSGLVPTGGFESTDRDPQFVFAFGDSLGWKATLTGATTLSVTTPAAATQELALVSGVNGTLNLLTSGDSSSREYGENGKTDWYFAKADGTLLSGSVADTSKIVDSTGAAAQIRTLNWKLKQGNLSAVVNGAGGLGGIYGLKPTGGNTSTMTVTSSGVSHDVVIARTTVGEITEKTLTTSNAALAPVADKTGPYQAAVYLQHDGSKQLVQIVDSATGLVRDPAFTTTPMGLDVDGSMKIGDQLLVQTALAFAGHIDENGGIALAANGNIVVQGFELGSSSFSFKHYPDGSDNGLTFSGTLKAPFQGTLSGEIHENGNFHVAGSIRLLVPGMPTTGFIGNVVMDPKESWLHGSIYVGGTKILYTDTKITSSSNKLNIDTGSGFNIGLGGYYVSWWFFGWHKTWVPYSGAKGSISANIAFVYKNPTSITANVKVWLQAWILDASLGSFNRSIYVPNLCAVQTTSVLGRNLDWRAIPLYLKWDAPSPLWDPQIGNR